MKKIIILFGLLLIVFVGAGVFLARGLQTTGSRNIPTPTPEALNLRSIPENKDIEVTVVKSKTKDNTVVLEAAKLDNKYTGISYEVTYETSGTFQGVNSGTKPIDVSNTAMFTRDVYLGTCSRNVCKPHTGVTQVSIVLELTDTSGAKSKFSQDFPL